jgi:hypothetical protein
MSRRIKVVANENGTALVIYQRRTTQTQGVSGLERGRDRLCRMPQHFPVQPLYRPPFPNDGNRLFQKDLQHAKLQGRRACSDLNCQLSIDEALAIHEGTAGGISKSVVVARSKAPFTCQVSKCRRVLHDENGARDCFV